MILDSLNNLKAYEALNPNFAKAIEFILGSDLKALPLGRNEIAGDIVYANVMEAQPKAKEEARLEIHRRYIDIQIPISGDEVMGYTPLHELPAPSYSEADDAALYGAAVVAIDNIGVKRQYFP